MRSILYTILRKSERFFKTDMIYLAKNTGWVGVSQVTSIVAGVLLAYFYANLLPKDTYGTYKYVMTLFQLAGMFALPGMAYAVIRSVARKYEGAVQQILRLKLQWSLLGTTTLLVGAGYYLFQGNTELALALVIPALFLPLTQTFVIYSNLLSGRKLFKQLAIYKILAQVITVITTGLVLYYTDDLLLLLVVHFVTLAITTVGFYLHATYTLKPNKERDEETVSMGSHLTVLDILGSIGAHLDKILLWHFLGPVALATYFFALMPIQQLEMSMKTIQAVAFPKLAARDSDTLRKTLPRKVWLLVPFVCAAVVAYILAAPFVFTFLFPEYMEAVPYTQLLVLSLLFFPQKILGATFTAHNMMRALYTVNVTHTIVRLVLMIGLIPFFGIYGAIAARVLPFAVNTITVSYFFRKL